MNIVSKWIFDSIDLRNLEEPVDKTGYICCTFISRDWLPYYRWLKLSDGFFYLPERQELYISNYWNIYNENTGMPIRRI